jgi:Ca-activated chloride channel family protein
MHLASTLKTFRIVMVNGIVVTVSLLASLAGPGSATPAAGARTSRALGVGQPLFRSSVEAVAVSVTVHDRGGRVVTTLTRGDFLVFEDGAPREVRDFYPGESAVSLAVLLDISGSMAVGGNMERAREAVSQAISHLQSTRDEAALFTFDTELLEVRAFTSDLQQIAALDLAGRPWGQTSLFDAIELTARRASKRASHHRAVLVITDGVDTGSRLTAAQVSGAASAIDVPVYLVVVANPVDNPARRLAVTAGGVTTEAATLADLARWTGGDMAIVSERAEVSAALHALMEELRHQYLITFEPSSQPGWHPIEIRTEKKDLSVRARSGYFTSPARPEP